MKEVRVANMEQCKELKMPKGTIKNNSRVTRIKRRTAKLPYEKPLIAIYSKEGKDFWCD
jgi:hypothetical protein